MHLYLTYMAQVKLILLDVYETLLDMREVERRINGLFDSKRAYSIWFELFMEYCFVDNCTVQFNDFISIAKSTLKMTARIFDVFIDEDRCTDVVDLLKQLPIKENVQEGLSLLHDKNFRIAALTNASEQTVRQRMELTGLISYFEKVLSAERVRKYKPCCEVYQWATSEMGVAPAEAIMVTSHGWDIAGAANAGLNTAYITGKQLLYPLAPKPRYIGRNLLEIAIALEKEAKSNSTG